MSQPTYYQLPNEPGLTFRQHLNENLNGQETDFAAAVAPSTTIAYMRWLDTSTTPPTLKRRNSTNTDWDVFFSDVVVSNIASLKSLKTTANSRAFVTGYYSQGDGGGGAYWLDTSDTSSVDNGGTIIVATDGGRWKLLNQSMVSVQQFGCIEGETNSTTKYQAAVNSAITNGSTLDVSGNYNVTSISLDGASGLRLTGRGSIVGIASSSTPALLTLKNVVNIAIDGAFFINCNYNTNYATGVWAYTDAVGQQAAYLDFTNLTPVNCKLAYKFGNDARPDDLVSEINVRGGHTFGCPSVIEAIGAQTVVNFTGCTLASLTGSGGSSWQALPQRTVVARGATVNITGGELLHVLLSTGGTSTTHNVLCIVETIASVASGNIYGSINVCGTIVETAARLASSSNPTSLASPVSGGIKFVGCTGVSTQDTVAFIETDGDFVGNLILKGNGFFSTTARSHQTISCGGLCSVYCDDESFGKNFIPWIQGTTGGILHFPYQMVFDSNNLNGQTLTNGTPVTLKPITVLSTGVLSRFSGAYSSSTGEFTVPAGGLKNIRIDAQILKGGLLGEWYVQINGVSYGVRTLGKYNHNSYSISSLNAGDKIKLVLLSTATTMNADSSVTDFFQIFASN